MEGYYTPREIDPNLFRKFDSYPISLPVLARLLENEVQRILVAERETRNVYEFTVEQYRDAPEFEWEHTDEDGNVVRVDKQRCASREDALHTWEALGKDLFHSPV